jgi:hypothetical protein
LRCAPNNGRRTSNIEIALVIFKIKHKSNQILNKPQSYTNRKRGPCLIVIIPMALGAMVEKIIMKKRAHGVPVMTINQERLIMILLVQFLRLMKLLEKDKKNYVAFWVEKVVVVGQMARGMVVQVVQPEGQ